MASRPKARVSHARKHGGEKRRLWRKIHLGVDERTLEIHAIEITGSDVGDAPMLPELLDQIPADVEIGSLTADGAYDTHWCHDAVAERGAHAVIPPRRNARPWRPSTAGAIARNEALRASKYLGRAIWRKWSGYHRRSRAETKMHCVKLLGQSLMSRDFDRQVAELQVRAAVLHGYAALGIPATEPAGQVRPGKGETELQTFCATKPSKAAELARQARREASRRLLPAEERAAVQSGRQGAADGTGLKTRGFTPQLPRTPSGGATMHDQDHGLTPRSGYRRDFDPYGGRRRGHDSSTIWIAIGVGAIVGAASLAYYQQATRNQVAHRPPDSAPGRTARRSRFGDYAVTGRTVTVGKSRTEIYSFWRDFANLPKFMENVRDIQVAGDITRWTVRGPMGRDVHLETRIVEDREGECISWRSTEGSEIDTEGKVTFRDAPAGRGTEVEAIIAYVPPAGELGRWVASVFQAEPALQGRRELRRLKMLMETGEIATNRNRTAT